MSFYKFAILGIFLIVVLEIRQGDSCHTGDNLVYM
jgi:hypothetical protein